jgi:hypothetical protein
MELGCAGVDEFTSLLLSRTGLTGFYAQNL